MKDQEIYQKISELLWSIMPEGATIMYFTGDIYPEHFSGGAKWLFKNRKIETFAFGERAYESENKICLLIDELRSLDIFKEKRTNYKVTLTEEGKFNIEFVYISEVDHWPGLYMKGVSDLKEEELDEYNIPRDEWEKRATLKEQNKNRFMNLNIQ